MVFDPKKYAKQMAPYYRKKKSGDALDTSKEITKIDDQLKEIKKRTMKNKGVMTKEDKELEKKLLLQKGGAYHSAGIDTFGFSQPSGDLGQPVDSGENWFTKVKGAVSKAKGAVSKGWGKFTANLSESALLQERITAITNELRAMRNSGKPLPIDPRTGKPVPGNELYNYARFVANTELQEHKKNTDPIGIKE
tara:strand:- start:1269 stop:1847 length:579 start_codon:yes stop_codon:yes gene_type:complete